MKHISRILLIVFIIFCYNVSFSQAKKKKYKDEIEKLNCAKNSNIRLEKRLANFPYNLTSQIKIVSFKNKEEGIIGEDFQKYLNLLVAKKDSIIKNKFDEILYHYSFSFDVHECKCTKNNYSKRKCEDRRR